jgi:flagellar basal-body rod protein FlgF
LVSKGRTTVENALLIGLSRQMTLERQIDVISNNIANVNTNGFKTDQPLFEEFLTSGAHEDNFSGKDRQVSFVQDRGTYIDLTQGSLQQTGNSLDVAIEGNGFLAVQTAGGERYTRDGNLQLNTQGQLTTESGELVLGNSGPIVFQQTDHDITISADGTITVVEGSARTDSVRGKLRVVNFADSQSLQKQGANLYAANNQAAVQADLSSTVRQGYVEKSNVNSVAEMGRMIEVSRTYSQIANLLQQQGELHKNAINQLAEIPT